MFVPSCRAINRNVALTNVGANVGAAPAVLRTKMTIEERCQPPENRKRKGAEKAKTPRSSRGFRGYGRGRIRSYGNSALAIAPDGSRSQLRSLDLPDDPDLHDLINAWPHLTPAIRVAVLGIVRASSLSIKRLTREAKVVSWFTLHVLR